MQFKPLVLLAACYVFVSVNVDAKNVGSIPGKSPEQGTVMLNDDLSNLDFCKGPIAFMTNSRAEAPVGCWRRVKDGVRVLWGPNNEAFFANRDVKWLGDPPSITPP
jgi:hypothetical protein